MLIYYLFFSRASCAPRCHESSPILIPLANLSLFKLAQRLRRFEGCWVCLAQRPPAVAPGTLNIPRSVCLKQFANGIQFFHCWWRASQWLRHRLAF